MLEHEQNMIALNDHLQMTRLRQQKRFVNPLLSMNSDMSVTDCVTVIPQYCIAHPYCARFSRH